MFYEPKNGHGLPHNPSKAIVSPRPIGWISTCDGQGRVNLAPYSFFNMLSDNPFLLWFSSDGAKDGPNGGAKDSANNAEQTGEFVANLATANLARQVVASSVDAPHGVDEFDYAGLSHAPCLLVKPPRVAEAAAALECKVTDVLRPRGLGGRGGGIIVVIGEVVGVHIDDAMLTNGIFDVVKAGNLSRLGYLDYSIVESVFPMRRSRWKTD